MQHEHPSHNISDTFFKCYGCGKEAGDPLLKQPCSTPDFVGTMAMENSMESFRELSFGDLREANYERQKEWDPEAGITEEYLGNALAGEVGETCNVVKKLARQRLGLRGSRATSEDLGEEIADVIIYADLLAKFYNIDLAEAVRKKFNKTSVKYNLNTKL